MHGSIVDAKRVWHVQGGLPAMLCEPAMTTIGTGAGIASGCPVISFYSACSRVQCCRHGVKS